MDGMIVNHIPGTNASAADLNFEATNPFGDEADAFVGVRLQSYDVVQGWLTVLKPESNDVACAKRSLKAALGVDGEIIDRRPLRRNVARSKMVLRGQLGNDAEIIERLPPRMSEDPLRLGEQRLGDVHKPHQICGLHWSILGVPIPSLTLL
ncbi:hypothetical protein J4E91_006642 [Alternaria rosae]|nr:hypothetical protein J4E91_006642 [Alternaria rosae]